MYLYQRLFLLLLCLGRSKGGGDIGGGSPIKIRTLPRLLGPRMLEFIVTSELLAFAASSWKVPATGPIVATNLAVFVMWQAADGNKNSLDFMKKHFLLDYRHFHERKHTILLSCFSHIDSTHIAGNMAFLHCTGSKLSRKLGSRSFCYLYTASIYASHLFDTEIYMPIFHPYRSKQTGVLAWIPFIQRKKQNIPRFALGASGAISAVVAYYCLTFPLDKLDLSKIQELSLGEKSKEKLEAPAWLVLLSSVAWDLFPSTETAIDNVGHGAHLGGYLFGVVAFVLNNIWTSKQCKSILRSTRNQVRFGCKNLQRFARGTKRKKLRVVIALAVMSYMLMSWFDMCFLTVLGRYRANLTRSTCDT